MTVETEPTDEAADGTRQRAVDVLDPDEPQSSSPHPQGGKK
jgi:hypothetical protein